MVNVAVSRAIDQFVIVTDNKLFNIKGQEIKSLLKYIKYNQMDSEIVESQIVSVFDLLYKEKGSFRNLSYYLFGDFGLKISETI